MWSTLRHSNVLPLLGVTMTGNRPAMVSEWMTNGNMNEFLKVHRNADRLGLVGLQLKLISVLIDDCATPVAGRRWQGAGISTWPGNDPR